ncbi:MAG: hypothetical protein CSA04_01550 [Bacteroidetes bacterium]|nr:MAG: hypothetical protein CSA04_01550 [Bacteroidota bacterium]
MQRKIVIILFLCVFCGAANTFGQKTFNLGVRGGYTSTKLAISTDHIKEGLRHNFHLGLFARLNGNRLFLQPEICLNNKGGILVETPGGGTTSITNRLDFVTMDIPLFLGIYLINQDNVRLSILAGPMASMILDSNFKVSETFDFIANQSFDQALWSAQAGVILDLFSFTLGVRTEIGLSDLSHNDHFDLFQRTLNISFGIKIL